MDNFISIKLLLDENGIRYELTIINSENRGLLFTFDNLEDVLEFTNNIMIENNSFDEIIEKYECYKEMKDTFSYERRLKMN